MTRTDERVIFVKNNMNKYLTDEAVRSTIANMGLSVDINNHEITELLEKKWYYFENGDRIDMKENVNFEKTFWVYDDNNKFNMFGSCMNDGSNFKVFFIQSVKLNGKTARTKVISSLN